MGGIVRASAHGAPRELSRGGEGFSAPVPRDNRSKLRAWREVEFLAECGLEVKEVTTAPFQKIHSRGAFDDQKAVTVVLCHAYAVRGNGFRTETHSPQVGLENLAARPQRRSKLNNERRESPEIWVATV